MSKRAKSSNHEVEVIGEVEMELFDDEELDSAVPSPVLERGLGGSVSDVLRKAVVTGLGAAIMTEEGLRSVLKDLKLPKEAVSSALGQAERGKDELRRLVGEELRHFLETPALKREISKALSSIAIEMTVKIRLNPEGKGPEVSFGQPRICRDPPEPRGVAASSAKPPKSTPT
ncbi:MAG: hypothetical protein LBM75_10445 [Myxococcales bacterium]|jgi:hypothetical protein|nr:hypothetical protein [Myxococcales bacterium]